MATARYFTPGLFAFFKDLSKNNSKAWFDKNKSRYESEVKEPAMRFITDFGPHLNKISEHFRADPRPVGGSLFRIHRDVRFSKDKSPYKTAAGIHFRHFDAKSAHTPGFYLHLGPDEVFMGGGIWHPDGPTLQKIRDAIVEDSPGWKKSVAGKAFRSAFELEGNSLSRPPRGFDPAHPLVEDLKRKDFMGVARLEQSVVTAPDFMKKFAAHCRAVAPLNRFVCEALGIPF